jgi:acetylornithine deacetylase/succinyl-diaminopimelate desuccinylase-like protein
MARTLALAACLILAIALAWLGEQPPAPRPADVPAGVFSAERAMDDVRIIARAPHPMGSTANAAVRDHLLRRMTALGLAPEVFTRTALQETRIDGAVLAIGGRPQVLVGVLPGQDRRAPAVALVAHYDSVAASPGAADDAAGVAAILETVRALKAQGPLRRDIVVVLTDGEEDALLGARAFFGEHPLARRLAS